MNQDNSSEDELNRYGVPIWLIEALKGYDSLMSSPKGQIKVNKMKAKRELYQLITLYTKERERLIQNDAINVLAAIIKKFGGPVTLTAKDLTEADEHVRLTREDFTDGSVTYYIAELEKG